MLPSEQLVDDLADAILDGTPIDWAAAESSSDGTAPLLVTQLRVLAAVAELHRAYSAESVDALSHPAVPHRAEGCGRAGDLESSSADRADRPGRVRRGIPGLGYAA